MRTASLLALALAIGLVVADRNALAQPKGPALKPLQIYQQFRETMDEGKFDIAGIFLDQFLKSDPSEDDFLELQKKYGTTVFRQLRAVPRYSDDPATEKKIRADIEELNKRADAVATKLLYNEDRVKKYIRNLGETPEEKAYAQIELRRTGEYAVPFMIDALRTAGNNDPVADGILDTIPLLESTTMAGWIAALEGIAPDRVPGVLAAIARRRDRLDLVTNAQTDFTPMLWKFLSRDPKEISPQIRARALDLLNQVYPGLRATERRPEVELATAAKKFYDHKARYIGAKSNPDGSPSTVPVWTWDAKALRLTKTNDVPVSQAEEFYGLRYARWALEAKPDYEPAQALILALVAERAVERAKGANLALAEPESYRLLAAAPSNVLVDLLVRGMGEKRTALVLGLIQVLGERADRAAALPLGGPDKPSPLVTALKYPDPSVQFAAAAALLRSPIPVPASAKQQIVDILRRTAGADPGVPGESKGTALIADPGKYRSDQNALLLRGFGFNVEQYGSGRDLMRRIARASDFDLIFIDRHTADPELIDLIAHLDSNPQVAARPVFVIASADKPRAPTFDQLLLRIAALIAATENDVVAMPAPYTPDPRAPADEQAAVRRKTQDARDEVFRQAVLRRDLDKDTGNTVELGRLPRLRRVIQSIPLTLTEPQRELLELRLQLITYAMLGAEFPITPESSPRTVADIERIRKQLALQPPTTAYGTGAPARDLMKLIERFELDVAKVPATQAKYDSLRSQVDPLELGLAVETYRDRDAEVKLARALQNYPAVRIIPEPYSRLNLEAGFKLLYADPNLLVRDAATKRADARAAVDFLKQMAVGDLPGYDLKSTEPVLLAALQVPDLASSAIDAVERFKTPEAQAALLNLALSGEMRPEAVRIKAADAVIRHMAAFKPAVGASLITPLLEQSKVEKNGELRGKFLTIKQLAGQQKHEFAEQLKGYSPPLVVAPKKEPEKKDPDMKEPEKKP